MAYLPGERTTLSCLLSYVKQTSLGCPRKHLNKTRQTDVWQTQSLHQQVYLLYLPVQMDGTMPITKSQVVQYIMCFQHLHDTGCMLSPCSCDIEPLEEQILRCSIIHYQAFFTCGSTWQYMAAAGLCLPRIGSSFRDSVRQTRQVTWWGRGSCWGLLYLFHTKFSGLHSTISEFQIHIPITGLYKSAPQSWDCLHVHGHFEPLAHVAVHCRWHPETVALYIIFI